MKRIALLRERASAASTGSTGSHCPASGQWSPEGEPHIVHTFFEGHVFPTHNGAATVWRRQFLVAGSR
ncbi:MULTISPECIES: hypothetical protein [Arthrobacter]|uniref:Uncharacterized protein n=1 Tax=Arthrobacter terricola TaxID=2547396 RepID=A0A4R5KSS0_9MICC|nr:MULTISPECIES: hypothetical protein [Arthrobacter]MBT8160475.1 hypothetical protein [Arthrobacter sp. GN70]TDF98482.1 hypothetical protein E1809_06835 [Arthrobacter terricola]HKU29797.1 hypothetical protein [Arthrobacter sp.]